MPDGGMTGSTGLAGLIAVASEEAELLDLSAVVDWPNVAPTPARVLIAGPQAGDAYPAH
ncbi:MAG TPA: hypothetical protein VGF43_02705 [Dongiaceae bacterium]|jgi:hypothetical protein